MRSRLGRWALMVLVSGVAGWTVGPAHAWGPRAHRIATRVAESRLTPAARAVVHDLLHEGDTLIDICDWADHEGHDVVPGSAPWHYVNVPISAPHYDDRYCTGGGCVVAKINHFRKVLADPHAPRTERARALLFFVHLVEDVHQPLHVGDNHDRGGNLTQIQYFNEGTNLHRLWDSQILEDTSRDEQAWIARITPLLTPEAVAAWSKGDERTWADESLQEAKKAYHFPAGSTRPSATGTRLGREYNEFAAPIIRLRLAQAGVRLANELNAIFAAAAPVKERRQPPAVPAGRD
jgi:hypothetical protein